MTAIIRPPLDPLLRRGKSLKASAAPPLLIRERPVRPSIASSVAHAPRMPILTRAELARCTCPEHCERDHTDE
jgi:hypothetical protein